MEEELETTFATWGWEVFFTELQLFLDIINLIQKQPSCKKKCAAPKKAIVKKM